MNNVMIVLPLVMFASNVKLLKEFTKSLLEMSTRSSLNEHVEDADSSIINQLLNRNLRVRTI